MKDNVYAKGPTLIQDLNVEIREAVEGIQKSLCDLVFENYMKKVTVL